APLMWVFFGFSVGVLLFGGGFGGFMRKPARLAPLGVGPLLSETSSKTGTKRRQRVEKCKATF
ncbi:hypothetical protein EGJ82_26625, partial [Klebsiella pneumoniae]